MRRVQPLHFHLGQTSLTFKSRLLYHTTRQRYAYANSFTPTPPSLPSFLYPLKKEDDDEASISDDDDDDESDSDKETSQKDIEIKVQPPSKSSLTAPSPRSVAKALLMDPDFNATLMLF